MMQNGCISNLEENFHDFANNDPHEEPTIMHTKKLRVGSCNIIRKGVIQDFFTCVGMIPMLGESILNKTNSLADAISLLLIVLQRQFVHIHPCMQRVFLEFSIFHHPSIKRIATIFLAHEFSFFKEAGELFSHYNINGCCHPIKEILFNEEEIMILQSPDYAAYNENLKRKFLLMFWLIRFINSMTLLLYKIMDLGLG